MTHHSRRKKKRKKSSYNQRVQHHRQTVPVGESTAGIPYLPTVSSVVSGNSERDSDQQPQYSKDKLTDPGIFESGRVGDGTKHHDRLSILPPFLNVGVDILHAGSKSLCTEVGGKDFSSSVMQTSADISAAADHHVWISCEAPVQSDLLSSALVLGGSPLMVHGESTPCAYLENTPPSSPSSLSLRPCLRGFLKCVHQEEYHVSHIMAVRM